MFWNKIAFFGAAAVMATSVIPASAQAPTVSSAASVGIVHLNNGDHWAYNVSATRMVRGANATLFGQLNMFKTNNARTSIVALIDKLDWYSSTSCCISGRLGYQNTQARIEFFLTKQAGVDYASWRIFRLSDNVVLDDSGKQFTGELVKYGIHNGGINLRAPL